MSNENEIRKVEKAVDDLQSTVEIHAYCVQNCTIIIIGSMSLTAGINIPNNLFPQIVSSIVIFIGVFGIFYNINTFKNIANRKYYR